MRDVRQDVRHEEEVFVARQELQDGHREGAEAQLQVQTLRSQVCRQRRKVTEDWGF